MSVKSCKQNKKAKKAKKQRYDSSTMIYNPNTTKKKRTLCEFPHTIPMLFDTIPNVCNMKLPSDAISLLWVEFLPLFRNIE